MSKTWTKNKPDRDDEKHLKRASRKGHSHKYLTVEQGINPAYVKNLKPSDILNLEPEVLEPDEDSMETEFENYLYNRNPY